MIKNIRIRVKPEIWADQQKLEQEIAQQNAISPKAIRGIRTIHRSIDARQRQVMIQLDVDVYINENPPVELFTPKEYREVKGDRQAVVVGLGPGGLFAALKLIEQLHKDGEISAEMFRNILRDYADIVDLSKFTILDEKEGAA